MALVIQPPEDISAKLAVYVRQHNAKAANKWPVHTSIFLAVPPTVLDIDSIQFKPFRVCGTTLYRTAGSKYMMLRIDDCDPLGTEDKHTKKKKGKSMKDAQVPTRIGELQKMCGNLLSIPQEAGRACPHITLGNMSQGIIDATISTLQETFEPVEFLIDHLVVLKDVKGSYKVIKRIQLVEE